MGCTQNSNEIAIVVTGTMTELASGSTRIVLQSVQNPSSVSEEKQGTGKFEVRTYSEGHNLIDENRNFGSISIEKESVKHPAAVQPSNMKSARVPNSKCRVDNDGTTLGGQKTNYVFSFQNTGTLAINSWFRLTMPSEYYHFGTVACQLPDHNNADLGCTLSGNVLLMSGLPVALSPSGSSSYQRIKVLNVYNPFRDGYSGLFYLESLKPGVNTILEYYGIPGTLITPGQIFNPLFNGYPSNLNQYVDYSITFTPMNHLGSDSQMQVVFPG